MKVTFRNARIDKSGKHNDRNFDLSLTDHIDVNKLDQNKYWTYNGNEIDSFADIERDFYVEMFSDHLDTQNKKNEEKRQKNRNKTIDDYRKGIYQPEDKLFQIGNVKKHVSGEQLWECALEYAERFNNRYGEHCKIIDMALHMDEATPHVHIRRVWIGEDAYGNKCVSQSKALELMGIREPDPTKPIGKTNNSKITFTYQDKMIMDEIIRSKGIEIDTPTKGRDVNLSAHDYKVQELLKSLEAMERRTGTAYASVKEIEEIFNKETEYLTEVIDVIESLPFITEEERIAAHKKKNLAEIYEYYQEILKKSIEELKAEEKENNKEYAKAVLKSIDNKLTTNFLKKYGLNDEFDKYREKHLKKLERKNENKLRNQNKG